MHRLKNYRIRIVKIIYVSICVSFEIHITCIKRLLFLQVGCTLEFGPFMTVFTGMK